MLVTAGPGFLDPLRHETSQRGASALSLRLAGQLTPKWSASAPVSRFADPAGRRVSVTNGTPARQNCSASAIDGDRMGRDHLYEYFL